MIKAGSLKPLGTDDPAARISQLQGVQGVAKLGHRIPNAQPLRGFDAVGQQQEALAAALNRLGALVESDVPPRA